MSGKVAVSVLMAVYDPDPCYLAGAVRSVLGQTFADFELLVVEDPGPRSAAPVLREIADPRVRHIVNDRRLGLGGSLNRGLYEARGDLVARLDADDVCRADRLEKQVAFMQAHSEIAVHGSRIRVIDENGRSIGRRLLPLDHEAIAEALQRFNCISHPAVMFRRRDVLAAGGYSTSIRAEDYDLWCRLLLAGCRFENSSEELISYRFHATALKAVDVHGQIRQTMEVKRRHFGARLSFRAHLRLLGERLLLLLPAGLIVELFRRLEYRVSPPAE